MKRRIGSNKLKRLFSRSPERLFLFTLLAIININYVIFSLSTVYAFPNTEVASISVGNGPYGIAGNGKYAVVAESLAGHVALINISNNTLFQEILVGTNPSMVAVTPDGSTAYVTNYGNNTVCAINLNSSSGFITSTVSVGNGPVGIYITDNTVFVTNYKDDTWSYLTIGSPPINVNSWGDGPISIVADTNATNVYVANSISNAVNVFQFASGTYGITTTITTGSYPDALLLVPNSTTLYVANANDNSISVIDTSSNKVVTTIALPSSGHPNGLALTPDNSTLMVMNSPTGGISYIQVSNNSVLQSLSLGSNLEQAYLSSDYKAYVTDYNVNAVYEVITPVKKEYACFIATAAYGSYDQFDVWVLRQFRNKILLKSEAGKWLVKTYYRTSPPIADFIAQHASLRAMVRVILKPFVFGSIIVLYATTIQKSLILFLLITFIIITIVGTEQRNKRLFSHGIFQKKDRRIIK